MKIISGIYVIRNKNNNKVYIGSSINIINRWREHRSALRRGTHDNDYLQKAWNKYGEDTFEFSVLEQCEITMLATREQFFLDTIDPNTTYNIARLVIGSMLGVKHTPEAKALMSKAAKGRTFSPETRLRMSQAQKGRTPSPETRIRLSIWQIGRKHTPAALAKMSLCHKGRKASDEVRAKMSLAHQNPSAELRYKFGNGARGKKRTVESIAKMVDKIAQEYIVISPDGVEKHIKNLSQFCKEHGLSPSHMVKVANLKRNHHKGWKCRRINDG